MNCHHCKKIIERHGNGRYCPETKGIKDYCYMSAKKIRQKKILKSKLETLSLKSEIIGYFEGILFNMNNRIVEMNETIESYLKQDFFVKSRINGALFLKFNDFQVIMIESSKDQMKLKISRLTNNDYEL